MCDFTAVDDLPRGQESSITSGLAQMGDMIPQRRGAPEMEATDSVFIIACSA
jgi:hypothetical protein